MSTMSQKHKATGRLVSTAEIAELIGASRQRAYQITQEPEFPAPVDVLGRGAIYWRSEVERFLRKRPPDKRVLEARIQEGRSRPR
jgi:predicted DNA-binding transcriptional regulator AlpA